MATFFIKPSKGFEPDSWRCLCGFTAFIKNPTNPDWWETDFHWLKKVEHGLLKKTPSHSS
jgi:hypothetical protein